MTPRFTFEDMDRANAVWGANCGPTSVAAICGLTLDEVRPYFAAAGFDAKRYTNPKMMHEVLNAIGRPWQRVKTSQPSGAAAHMPWWGLCRIQWHGPWTDPGANPRWAYRQTHWIGAAKRKEDGSIGVYDCNAMAPSADGSGWTSLEAWSEIIAPWIIRGIPRATGGWHVTHAIEVGR